MEGLRRDANWLLSLTPLTYWKQVFEPRSEQISSPNGFIPVQVAPPLSQGLTVHLSSGVWKAYMWVISPLPENSLSGWHESHHASFKNIAPGLYYRDPIDFRKAHRGLAAIVETELGHNLFDGHLYAFTNRQQNIKAAALQQHPIAKSMASIGLFSLNHCHQIHGRPASESPGKHSETLWKRSDPHQSDCPLINPLPAADPPASRASALRPLDTNG